VDAIVDSIASEERGVTIELIKYHMYWPSSGDTFYIYNQPENNARRNYYGLNYVPWLAVDGIQSATGSPADIAASIEARLLTPTPLEISVADTLIGDSVYVTAQVIAVGDVDTKATYTFQCAVVENWHKFMMMKYRYMMRDMVPNAAGESFTISMGDTVTFERVWWMDPNVYWPIRMNTLVFVQNPATKEILNSASTEPSKEHFMWYMAGDANTVIPPDSAFQFVSYAYNLGLVPDTFTVDIASTLPAGWTSSYTTSHGTYTGLSQIFLDPEGEETILVNVDPANNPGNGEIEVSVTGLVGDGVDAVEMTRPRQYAAIHDVDVLIVDDDGTRLFEDYYKAALDSTELLYGTWPRSRESITAADLAWSDAVIWFTGRSYPTLTYSDRNALEGYLLGGGNAFISGQDIGWALCDLSSEEWTPGGATWYRTYLGALYTGDDAESLSVYGVGSDPVSDGLMFAIEGGDGANNTGTQDLIEPFGSGSVIFHYSAGESLVAGVRMDSTDTFKTVYLPFGFEAIDNAQDRADLMTNIMDWFGLLGTTAVEEAQTLVKPAYLAQNVPNPFNPETQIRFSVPERLHVRLNVYNVQGQLIQVLRDGVMGAGEHAVRWNGLDRNGHSVASGLYFYSLEAGEFAASRKMILLR